MSPHADTNWWSFSIDTAKRKLKVLGNTSSGAVEVNADGKMDYNSYLRLDTLLSSQVPSSQIPDERVFLITHQLFELVFKLMIFDLAVIARTFRELLKIENSEQFLKLCIGDEDFWRPALTASGRMRFNAKTLLLDILQNLKGEETFSTQEFFYFRPNLLPASGFQTAQYRLIQRAFGKSNLLALRLFPSDMYHEKYESKREASPPITVVDPLILRQGVDIATPSEGEELAIVKDLDDLAHAVLSRLPDGTEGGYHVTAIKQIRPKDTLHAVERLETNLRNHRTAQMDNRPANAEQVDQEALRRFKQDVEGAAGSENDRRKLLNSARAGAVYLRRFASRSYLLTVLKNLEFADEALHGHGRESFLARHFTVAQTQETKLKKHALDVGEREQPTGTGGGGTTYLTLARQLIELFPALIACRDLEDVQESPLLSLRSVTMN
jgi:tryptophan 2,3-dioxygenase